MWDKILYAIITAILALLGITLPACNNPDTPTLQNTVQQGMQATALSMFEQVKWENIAARLSGEFGPETLIEVEGYIKQSAGATIRIHGGKASWSMDGQGVGGNSNTAVFPQLKEVMTRWEAADDRAKAQNQKWEDEIVQAFREYIKAQKVSQ